VKIAISPKFCPVSKSLDERKGWGEKSKKKKTNLKGGVRTFQQGCYGKRKGVMKFKRLMAKTHAKNKEAGQNNGRKTNWKWGLRGGGRPCAAVAGVKERKIRTASRGEEVGSKKARGKKIKGEKGSVGKNQGGIKRRM